jgi:hypothetical protein
VTIVVLAGLALAVAALAVGLALFTRAYDARLQTELETNARIRRLQAWQDRADSWERWADATGGSIPQAFLDEIEQITR